MSIHILFEQLARLLVVLVCQVELLIKLIQRETDQTSYDIVRAFLGSTRALFWQGFGRFFGVNLKGRFEPDKNREDEIINRIATRLEEGTL